MNRQKSRSRVTSAARRKPKNAKEAIHQDTKAKQSRYMSPRVPYLLVLFVALWLFGWLVYGNAFYMSEQMSYFAWSKTLMAGVLSKSFGWLYAAGRLLMTTFHYPVLGSALLALILTLTVWFLEYLTGMKGKWKFVLALLPFAYLAYFVGLHYSMIFHRETSLLFGYALLGLAATGVLAGVKRLFFKVRIHSPFSTRNDSLADTLVTSGTVVAAFIAMTVFCVVSRDDFRNTCLMMRQMENAEWDEMIDEALSTRHPSRNVAAYYAIALAETGQLESRLFELPFDYPRRKVREVDGTLNDGATLYSIDCDFYAGLINSSYHGCMESMVRMGQNVFLLKRMARAAAMNSERRLCFKYLTVLDRCPFEHDFVEKYKGYLKDLQAMRINTEFAHVSKKTLVKNHLEQRYRSPYFLGYNVALMEGRSVEALNASLMALLYSKDQRGFMERVSILRDNELPLYYQQQIMALNVSDPSVVAKEFPTINSRLTYQQLMNFVSNAKPYFKNLREGQKALKEEWLGYFPYYLYFENLPDSSAISEVKESEKGGVN